ncbi:lipase [Marmoricola endophyticus]|uniref:Lipase n=1 Tax=Marmoricola endophyticus TaxID=2040280 RepID=A0A917BHJ5_9ACTN|nr:SGNH/GDSL hydrolase family protein [Marmoricola endophyticus]GGF42124.1 lipase [Marmoricola endophyticus]
MADDERTLLPRHPLARAAVAGGGGAAAAGVGLLGVAVAEARIARRVIGVTDDPVPDATGWYGGSRPRPALRIALLGDSSAAGYGVSRVQETPGAYLAAGVARWADRRVHLRAFCRVGARSSELAGQVERALERRHTPDVAVILIGANDVTHAVPVATSVRLIARAVHTLREAGVEVVVGTCPDLGTIRPIPPPLKQMVRLWSRRLAARQTVVTVREGGRSVSLGSILGPEFDAAPAVFFGPDRFHPSAKGYASLAAVLIPSVLSAVGAGPEDETHPAAQRGEGVLSVEQAAADAARNPGTEVGGSPHSPAGGGGRWATLRRRRRHAPEEGTPTEQEEQPGPEDAGDTASTTEPTVEERIVAHLDDATSRLDQIVVEELGPGV